MSIPGVGQKQKRPVHTVFVEPDGEAAYGARTFQSIREAVLFCEAHPENQYVIQIAPGIYRERLVIRTKGLTLRGEDGKEQETRITGSLGAYEILEDGMKRGTFRTQTVLITADDVTLENLTIENKAGPGHVAGQAIALHAYGDRLRFHRLRLVGQQDTLFTGPLPEKEVEPGGFRGPTEHFPRKRCRMFFYKSYIEGNIDFIFGGACAWFEQCELFCRDSGSSGKAQPLAYMTAPSTPAGQEYGYVMNRCSLTSDCPPESCFLGRPWREDAKCVFLHCSFGPHIRQELWDDWGKKEAHKRSFFAIFDCRCAWAEAAKDPFAQAAPFSQRLTEEEAEQYKIGNVLQMEEW